jgi:hypothetical protein
MAFDERLLYCDRLVLADQGEAPLANLVAPFGERREVRRFKELGDSPEQGGTPR